MHLVKSFLDFIDQRAVVRRLVLIATVWMTWRSFLWAAEYADQTVLSGTEAGLIIAAVTAPIAALQGFIFKVYADGRS